MSSVEVSHLGELLQRSVERYPNNSIFGTRAPSGIWSYISYAEFGALVDAFRGA